MASLHDILDDGELSIFKAFLQETEKPELTTMLAKVDDKGNTPLHVLCEKGLAELVVQVLNTDLAPLEHQNKNGLTPLGVAASKSNSEIVCLLLASGADSSDVDQNGLQIFTTVCEGASKHQLITAYPLVAELNYFKIKPPPLVFIKFAEVAPERSKLVTPKVLREKSLAKKSSRKRDRVIAHMMYWESHVSDEEATHEESEKSTPKGFQWLQTTTPGLVSGESGPGDSSPTGQRGLMLSTRNRSKSKSGEDEAPSPTTFSDEHMESWPKLKVLSWLKNHDLEWLKPLYAVKTSSFHDLASSTKCSEKREAPAFEASAPARFTQNPDRHNHILLQSAPLQQILEYLILDDKAPIFSLWDRESFITDFINCYQNFTDSNTVFQFMKSNFGEKKELSTSAPGENLRSSAFKRAAKPEESLNLAAKKKRILSFFEKWIMKDNARDFTTDSKLEVDCNAFLAPICTDPLFKEFRHLKNLIASSQKLQESYFTQTPEDLPMKTIFSCPPPKMAAYITESMETMMDRVSTNEFLKQACHNPKYKHLAPNLFQLFHFIEGFSNWVNYEILHITDSAERVKALVYFLETTAHLRELNNFGGVAIIVSTLSASHFAKLKKDWAHVPATLSSQFAGWTNLISNVGKFKAYKEAIAALPPQAKWFPILQIAVGDIAKMDEVTGNLVDEPKGWVNWGKASIISKLISSVKIPGRHRYALPSYPSVSKFIESREKWDNPNANYNIAVFHETETNVVPVSILDPFLAEDLQKLKAIGGQHTKFADGEAIVSPGVASKTLYFLVSGSVTIKRGLASKRGFNFVSIGNVKESSMFGEISVFLYGKPQAQTLNIAFFAKGEVETLAFDMDQISGDLLAEKTLINLHRPELRRLLRAMAVKVAVDMCQDKGGGSGDEKETEKAKELRQTLSQAVFVSSEEKSVLQTDFDVNEPILREIACQYGKSTAGTLYLSANYICFLGRSFGLTKKIKSPIGEVAVTSKRKRQLTVGDDTFSHIREDVKELTNYIHTLQTKRSPRTSGQPSSRSLPIGLSPKTVSELTNLQLSEESWSLVLKGAQTHHFKAGQTLMDSSNRRLHQIVSGEVNVVDSTDKVLYTMKAPARIGSLDFLLQESRPNLRVVAKDDVSMTTICSYYLDMLFSYQPALAAQFLFYLGSDLAERSTAKLKPPVFV